MNNINNIDDLETLAKDLLDPLDIMLAKDHPIIEEWNLMVKSNREPLYAYRYDDGSLFNRIFDLHWFVFNCLCTAVSQFVRYYPAISGREKVFCKVFCENPYLGCKTLEELMIKKDLI